MSKAKRRTSGRVVLFSALVGGAAALVAAGVPDAVAQETVGDGEQQAQAGAAPVAFSIPAQPLAQALTQFGRQSGLQVAVDSAAVAGKSSAAVSGTMSAQSALQQLLSGTGVTYRFTSPNAVSVVAVAAGSSGALQLDPVQVKGNLAPPQAEIGAPARPYAGGQVDRNNRLGMLGNRDYMDTPFSVTTYTDKTIKEQQAVTLIDVTAVDPTVRSMYSQSSGDDRLMIRGFSVVTRDMAFNGLYGVTPSTTIGMTGIEKVEVFRGPTALLYGLSVGAAVGGMVNLVSKRAPDEDITQVTARYGSTLQAGGEADVARRFGPDKSLGIRAGASFFGGPTAINNNSDSLLQLTLGMDYRSDTTRMDADLRFQKRNMFAPRFGNSLAVGQQLPAAPYGSTNNKQAWAYNHTDDLTGMFRFEHDFAPNLTAYAKIGGRRSNFSGVDSTNTIVNAQGNVTGNSFWNASWGESLSAEVGGRGKLETGPVRHDLSVSGTYNKIDSGFNSVFGIAPIYTSNIYNPVGVPMPNTAGLLAPPMTSQTLLTSVGVMDALSMMDDRLQIIGGVRLQRAQVSNYSVVTGLPTAATPGYDQSALTPAASFVIKPWKEFSFYGNYIEGLERGPVAGAGLVNAGQAFSPFVARQFEVGAKLDLGDFGATLSAFSITRPSSYVDVTTNSLVVNGQQRNQGIEFMMFGEPFKGFRPLGGFTLLDPRLTQTAGGLTNGNLAPGVPTAMVNLGFDWDTPFVKGLALQGRVTYTSQAYLDAANRQAVPAWTRVDIGASYTFERADGKPLSLRANVINVGNTNYWIANSGFVTQNQPRTFLLSLTADF